MAKTGNKDKPSFRILDLGCCDAGIPVWLQKKIGDNVDLHIDGIDLDKNMIRSARDRAVKHGISGVFKLGNASDAPKLFEAGSYDAVVAYELIEHVKDPDEFLAQLEVMVKSDGWIYISTPDGVFGEGNNPHHLRALRANELADILRRRGELQNMTVGSDGVTVAAYKPTPKKEDVAIFLGGCWQQWPPTDIETKGLGGSETAAVRLAECLSKLGYIVTVYGDVEETVWCDVMFRRYETFDPTEARGIFISSRIPEVFDRPVNAKSTMLWVHDVDCGDRLTPDRAAKIDHVLALSDWHENNLANRYPFLGSKIKQIRNGITPAYFRGPVEPRQKRVLYTSSPDRGLDVLLELWPKVLEQVPDAELWHCYADVYDAVAERDPVIKAHRDRIRELADQPGVQSIGSLSQPKLALLMRESMVWAHPSWISQIDNYFHETYCIGAVEAQAAGCLVVATGVGALRQTVKVGRIIPDMIHTDREEWEKTFVAHIVEGLTNDDVQEWVQKEAPEAVKDLGWQPVAGMIHDLAVPALKA